MFKLLIVGATGLVGGEVLKLALEDARVSHVLAITRRPVALHPKLENQVINFDALPQYASWWKVDAGICALGTTRRETKSKQKYHAIDVAYPLAIAALIRRNGATSFALTSSTGAFSHSLSSYLRMKGEAEEGLARLGFPSLSIVRPSFISGTREKARLLESVFLSMFCMLNPILPKRWRSVSASRIAKALLKSVINPKPGITIRESETL